MLRTCVVVALLCPAIASASPRRAVTAEQIRIDREIGDSDGLLDDLEVAVARAAYDVFRATGINVRPRLKLLPNNVAGYQACDADGPLVYITRAEDPATVGFTVFHEAGHVAHRHDLTGTSLANELSADEFEGRLLAATGGNLAAALKDCRRRADPVHGNADTRAAALLRGYLTKGPLTDFSSAKASPSR
jgi:hypothetical protein